MIILNIYLAHNKIQKLNFVIGHFNVNFIEKLVNNIDLQFFGHLKWEHA